MIYDYQTLEAFISTLSLADIDAYLMETTPTQLVLFKRYLNTARLLYQAGRKKDGNKMAKQAEKMPKDEESKEQLSRFQRNKVLYINQAKHHI